MTNEVAKKVDRTGLRAEAGLVLGGRYELLVQIAKGGMGNVWAARAKGGRGFRRVVAVKTMVQIDYEEARMGEMLFQEARFASMIQHPNVVAVEDFGEHEGICYLAMELVRGETLLKIVKASGAAGGLPTKIAVNLVGQVCRGLQATHDLVGEDGRRLDLVHRDVTPGNIIVSYGGVAKLSDFGIAKAGAGTALTQAGELKGKMSYMAPEQLLQKPTDRRVDIFAMGVTLYLATTGIHPFRMAGGSGEVLSRILSDSPAPPPSSVREAYPERLEEVVTKAIAKDPDQRYSTAKEMLEGLMGAMPEAFEAGVEKEVQEYLEQLFSDRISETTASIRAAEEMAESASSVRERTPKGDTTDRSARAAKKLFAVLGVVSILSVLTAIITAKSRRPEIVEKTRTVYLPGEVKIVTVAASAPAIVSQPSPPARPAAMSQKRATRREEEQVRKEEGLKREQESQPVPETRSGEVREEARPASADPVPVPVPTVARRDTVRTRTGPRPLQSSEGQKRLAINPSAPPYSPVIPRAMKNLGPFTADVRMCVGPDGAPMSISMANVNPILAAAFQKAMTKWRYRPLTEADGPAGFCYPFRYEVQ